MVARKTIRRLPRKTHKFLKAVLTLNLIGRAKLLFLFMQFNFHNTLQCWEIRLANVQENRRTELAFKTSIFPKGRANKGLDPRGRNTPAEILHH